MDKEYLGDSVYVAGNEWHDIVLTTENGLPRDPSNIITFDDDVTRAFIQYIKTNKPHLLK